MKLVKPLDRKVTPSFSVIVHSADTAGQDSTTVNIVVEMNSMKEMTDILNRLAILGAATMPILPTTFIATSTVPRTAASVQTGAPYTQTNRPTKNFHKSTSTSTPEPETTIGVKPTGVVAVINIQNNSGVPGVGSPTCVFPFVFNGTTYTRYFFHYLRLNKGA